MTKKKRNDQLTIQMTMFLGINGLPFPCRMDRVGPWQYEMRTFFLFLDSSTFLFVCSWRFVRRHGRSLGMWAEALSEFGRLKGISVIHPLYYQDSLHPILRIFLPNP